jgi:hypothetical protein
MCRREHWQNSNRFRGERRLRFLCFQPARVAHSVEQLTRNEQVAGSIPASGSSFLGGFWAVFFRLHVAQMLDWRNRANSVVKTRLYAFVCSRPHD